MCIVAIRSDRFGCKKGSGYFDILQFVSKFFHTIKYIYTYTISYIIHTIYYREGRRGRGGGQRGRGGGRRGHALVLIA